ncbi:unnamed protein product [Phaeothamnion confervicola]
MVGYITGIMGLAQVIAAPAGGFLGDKLRRSRALALSAGVGLTAAAVLTAAVAANAGYGWLCVASVVWGVFWAISNPAIEALYADSVPNGQRTIALTAKYILLMVASATGPALAVALFFVLGDQWSRHECAIVIIFGVALSVVSTSMLFFFGDPPSTPNPLREPLLAEAGHSPSIGDVFEKRVAGGGGSGCSNGGGAARGDETPDTESLYSSAGDEEDRAPGSASSPLPSQHLLPPPLLAPGVVRVCGRSWAVTQVVPIGVAASDVLSGLASGMSIKFFPIFFMENVGLLPVTVSAIYAVAPLATGLVSLMAGRTAAAARRRGGIVIATKVVGISLLVALCVLCRLQAAPWMLVSVFLVRTALMNCSKPLTRAIIMDCVPKRQRARWSAIESVNRASWAGSAVVGGILVVSLGERRSMKRWRSAIWDRGCNFDCGFLPCSSLAQDRFGVLNNFYATAVMQAAALLPLIFVSRWEPEEGNSGTAPPAPAAAAAVVRAPVRAKAAAHL